MKTITIGKNPKMKTIRLTKSGKARQPGGRKTASSEERTPRERPA